MIVVIGQPVLTRVEGNPVATGSAARIALTAADRGAAVQLVGKVGDDPDGEALSSRLPRATSATSRSCATRRTGRP